MRASMRLFARYLEPGMPTGLTGLFTRQTPRATLLSIYGATLEKLKTIPEASVYRQSVEALTKHRMEIVKTVVPPSQGTASDQPSSSVESSNISEMQEPTLATGSVKSPNADLTADLITELEAKLRAGLIEEVIEVAKGELLLIDIIRQSRAWEPLEDPPVPGQWQYFDRPT